MVMCSCVTKVVVDGPNLLVLITHTYFFVGGGDRSNPDTDMDLNLISGQ